MSERNLWLPNTGRGLQPWIPESARQKQFRCTLCPKRFPATQFPQFARHVKACSKKHDDEIQAQLAERKTHSLFSPADEEQWKFRHENPRNKGRKRKMKGLVGT